jgi:hypothetical protein
MQSPGLLIFPTSRYSLILNSDRYSIARSRLGIEVPSLTPLSVTVRTHPIKHFLDLIPLWSELTWARLQPQDQLLALQLSLGSIGSALAVALVAAGCNKVVFFGRRPDLNPEVCQHLHLLIFLFSTELGCQVIKELSSLPPSARSQCSYCQVDVCDLSALKFALSDINPQFGGVKNIVHTAAMVNNATIASTIVAGFENVIRPKVIGSWNLHITSQDLNLALKSFILFSITK